MEGYKEDVKQGRIKISRGEFSLQIIGAHNYIERSDEIIHCMIPYLDNTLVNGLPLSMFNIVTKELYEMLKQAIPRYGDEQYEMLEGHAGTASKLVGGAMVNHVMRAFSDPEYIISMSVWDPKRKLYVTWPTKIKDMLTDPLKIDLSDKIYEDDFNTVCEKVLKPNVEYLRSMGVTAEPKIALTPIGRTLKGKLEDHKEEYTEDFEKLVRKVGRRQRREARKAFDKVKDRIDLDIQKHCKPPRNEASERQEEPEEPQQPNLEGKLYYVNIPGDSLVIKSQQLSPEVTTPDKKYKVEIDNRRYDSKIALRKIIPHKDQLFIEGLYEDRHGTKRSHWIWFDTTNGKKQGTIKPEGVIDFHYKDRAKTPIQLCFHDNILMDTATFFQDKLYFIIETPEKSEQVIEFDPSTREYELLGSGAIDNEPLTCMTAVEDDLILGGDRNLYRLHNGRLKHLSKTACSAYHIRSLHDERTIVYSDGKSENIYAMQIDNPSDQTEFKEGPYFDIHQNGDIFLASLSRGRIQLSKYSCIDNFLTNKEELGSPVFSRAVENLKRVVIPNEDTVIGISDDNSRITIQTLYSSNLQPCKDPIIVENASHLMAKIDVK